MALQLCERAAGDASAVAANRIAVRVLDQGVDGLLIAEQLRDLLDAGDVDYPFSREQANEFTEDVLCAEPMLPNGTCASEQEPSGGSTFPPPRDCFGMGGDAVFPNALVENGSEDRDVKMHGL